MKKIFFALIFLGAASFSQAQTTIVCITAGYCGNSLTQASTDSGNNGLYFGYPLSVNATYSITNCKVNLPTATGNGECVLVCDTNLTGATIANLAGACGANNVVCSTGSVALSSGTNTLNFTGCSLPLTGVRYWLLFNSSVSVTNATTTTGTISDCLFWIGTFGSLTVGTSLTGPSSGDGGEGLAQGITLSSGGGGGAPAGQFPRVF